MGDEKRAIIPLGLEIIAAPPELPYLGLEKQTLLLRYCLYYSADLRSEKRSEESGKLKRSTGSSY